MPTTVDTDRLRRLLEGGAQLVDVLPAETFRQEHLPGATNLPLAEIGRRACELDPARPVVVYCYDLQCDLSPRAAAWLEHLGFPQVYDYAAGKVAWLAEGLPGSGLLHDQQRAGSRVHRDVPRLRPDATVGAVAEEAAGWDVVAVVDERGVLLGESRTAVAHVGPQTRLASVMQAGPPTVRPSIPVRELARSMDEAGQRHIFVTTLEGELIGLVRRSELHAS
jgi:rhodanese-related sulfurtransferase/CBS domain-containing protein